MTSMPMIRGVGQAFMKNYSQDKQTIGMSSFGVSRGFGIKLTERLEVVHGEVISKKVEEHILECAANFGDWVTVENVKSSQTYAWLERNRKNKRLISKTDFSKIEQLTRWTRQSDRD